MAKKDYKYEQRVKSGWKDVKKDDIKPSGDQVKVRTSFEYVSPGDAYCLSLAESDDVKHAMDCFRKLTSLTWIQVLQTATKQAGEKAGLHWTPYPDNALNVKRPARVSPDHKIVGIRAGGKYRIFGFRFEAYFYPIWFDPEHKVCDG